MTTSSYAPLSRPLYRIGMEIHADWPHVNIGAMPYLAAMCQLDDLGSYYGEDRGDTVVAYFLSNADEWQTEKATAIKRELETAVLQYGRTHRPF